MYKLLSTSLIALCMIMGVSSMALASDYPDKPVTLLTVFDPGGGSDVSHRIIEKYAKQHMDQPFVITYKAGAGGEIGWTELALTKPTGYFIGGVDLPHILLQPLLRNAGQPGYQTDDLNPICGLVFDPNVVMAKNDSQFKTFAEVIAYAKENPGALKVATVGKLTGDHLFLIQIENLTGAKFTQIPYSGGGKAAQALLSGEADLYFGSTSNFLRMENTQGLAIATKERFELCPDVPTFIEIGINLESAKFRGLASPKGIPAEAQAYLESVLSKMAADPEYQQAVKDVGILPVYQTSEEFKKTIQNELETTKELLKNINLK